MYRQATQMECFDVHVICRQYTNQDSYPPRSATVVEAPQEKLSRNRFARGMRYLLNWRHGFFSWDRERSRVV